MQVLSVSTTTATTSTTTSNKSGFETISDDMLGKINGGNELDSILTSIFEDLVIN